MGRKMGLDFGLESKEACFKLKNRWLFIVPSVASEGISTKPPLKGSRPVISFKEMEVQHLSETMYYPSKPDWKPITLTLYDTTGSSPVSRWLYNLYNPKSGTWGFPAKVGGGGSDSISFIKTCSLELYNGCGDILERWTYEDVWPQQIDWGDLDMGNAEVVTIDLTLRYGRAYLEEFR
jgi:hypothetical protein